MGKIVSYLKGVMADSNGSPSSKRLVTLLAAVLVFAGFLANLFWDYTVEEYMYTNMMYIVIAGLGITGAEKFAPQRVVE